MKWLMRALEPAALQLAGVAVQLLAAAIRAELERPRAAPPPDAEPRLPLGK